MRKKICKWFFAWNFDKEETWLNEMAATGLALVAVSGICYTFEQSEPGEYGIRIELLNDLPSHPESEQYIRLLGKRRGESVRCGGCISQQVSHRTFDCFRITTADTAFEPCAVAVGSGWF